jgi:hypothetical protein
MSASIVECLWYDSYELYRQDMVSDMFNVSEFVTGREVGSTPLKCLFIYYVN